MIVARPARMVDVEHPSKIVAETRDGATEPCAVGGDMCESQRVAGLK